MAIFLSRKEAGEALAQRLSALKFKLKNPIVFGIPRGGVPIAHSVAEALDCPLDTLVLRKLPIPDNPEAGFGAVTLGKTVILNDAALSGLDLSGDKINKIINEVYREVIRRNKTYRQKRPFPILNKRSVILTDDGLASGYTMLAAVKFARERSPQEIIVAVPVAHKEAYNMVHKEVDRVISLYVSGLTSFAVASFYNDFPDLSDEEVIFYLRKSGIINKS